MLLLPSLLSLPLSPRSLSPHSFMVTFHFPLLTTFLFVSTTFSFSSGLPNNSISPAPFPLPTSDVTEGVYGAEGPGVIGPSDEQQSSSPFVLAAQRTYRKDPLNGFRRYTGGWDIRNHHYWASVSYTAVPVFAVAAIWFVGFALCLLIIFVCSFCCQREPYGYSRAAYALSLIFLVLFTIAAMLGCLVLYIGQGRFHRSTTQTVKYVVEQADSTITRLRDVSDSLASARQVGVDQVFLPASVQTDIDQIELRLNSSASFVTEKTKDSSDDIEDLLDSVRIALIVVSAIMLLLTFLGFLFSIFGMQLLVYILVVLGWLLVTGMFILCGTFLLLHNVSIDTCVAMNEWAQNPTAHTALDEILPCVDNATAQETLVKSREVTQQLVDVVNQVITNVSNLNFSPNFKPVYINQSGPLVPQLCNPYHPDLTDRVCSPGEVDLNNATQVWSSHVCEASPDGICKTTGRLTPGFYNSMALVVNVSLALINDAPFLVELQDCSFVRDTFTGIYVEHCPGLERYSRWIYIGLVMVSTAVMLSLIFWVIYGRERRHRIFNKQMTENLEPEKDS